MRTRQTSSARRGIASGSVRTLVRDPAKERPRTPAEGVLTTDFAAVRNDPSIAVVAEVMGGIGPTRAYIHELPRAGKAGRVRERAADRARRPGALPRRVRGRSPAPRRGERLHGALVIKVLREAVVVTNVHRVLGIVNGTTNFVLIEAQRRVLAEADPDVSGADAAAAEMNMAVRLVGSATLVDEKVDVRVGPALVDRHHPLAAVEGARDGSVEACAADLFSRFPDVRVLRLSVSPQGAGPA